MSPAHHAGRPAVTPAGAREILSPSLRCGHVPGPQGFRRALESSSPSGLRAERLRAAVWRYSPRRTAVRRGGTGLHVTREGRLPSLPSRRHVVGASRRMFGFSAGASQSARRTLPGRGLSATSAPSSGGLIGFARRRYRAPQATNITSKRFFGRYFLSFIEVIKVRP